MAQRFALYYAPSVNTSLWERASAWLGRDPATEASFEGAIAGIERAQLLNRTQSAHRYGFHATLKPPMQLAEGREPEALRAALAGFAETAAPVTIGRLQVAELDGFLALVPTQESAALRDFAALVVEAFEPFRAPLDPRDRAARAANGLTPRQEELLDAYGYPYVLDEFRFHMTLTDRLAGAEMAAMRAAAATWFAPDLGEPLLLDRLVLYHEAEKGRPFRRLEDFRLNGAA